jgi:uridine phosphorylase
MKYLFHLFQSEDFTPILQPESLESEGFVHLSSAMQLLGTASRYYSEANDLKVMVLNAAQLSDNLKWEDLYDRGEEFPHHYAPIPASCVAAVVPLERDEQGFHWPEVLLGMLSPLLEPLNDEMALIEPSKRFPEPKLPQKCLLCFFPEVLEKLAQRDGCQKLQGLGSEIGATDVLTMPFQGETLAVCHPGVGGSLAAATLEELIALGCRDFFLCGGAGSLVSGREVGHLILADRAWRDEGTSHHYLSPEPTVDLEASFVEQAQQALESRGVSFEVGHTWTTDGLYREVPSRIARRREAGCLTVEMEVASLAAVARFRQARLGALLYCGDDVGSDQWDFRDWTGAHSVRERLFWLGMELLRLLT